MVNSKWIKDLNISHESLKLLEENIGKNLNINMSNFFLNASPWARETKVKNELMGLHQTKKASVRQRTPSVEQKDILQYGRIYL